MSGKKTPPSDKFVVAQNRKARHNYFIEETVEAGIVLTGTEVKSLRNGKSNIVDTYAGESNGELYLFNAYIPEYDFAKAFSHQPRRPRKLLLKKREINKLLGKVKSKGRTMVALSVYFNKKGKAKVEIALVSGKKQHDKRQTEKDRDWGREKSRILKNADY
jgi:SsrA-binding protein